MIARLRSPLNHHDVAMSVVRGFGDDLQEQCLGYMVRAGTRDQGAARSEDLHGPKIYFLVAAMSGGNAVAVLGKGRRIENDHVEAALFVVVLLEQIEGISLFEGDIRDLIQFLIAAGGGYCGGREIDRFYARGVAGDAEGESAVVAE